MVRRDDNLLGVCVVYAGSSLGGVEVKVICRIFSYVFQAISGESNPNRYPFCVVVGGILVVHSNIFYSTRRQHLINTALVSVTTLGHYSNDTSSKMTVV